MLTLAIYIMGFLLLFTVYFAGEKIADAIEAHARQSKENTKLLKKKEETCNMDH